MQKKLQEKHGRMETLLVYSRTPDPSKIMDDIMKTFDDYGIQGAPFTSEPVVRQQKNSYVRAAWRE